MNPVWSQSYTLFGRGLAFSAVIASLPILILLFLLGVRRKPAWFASLFALLAALVIALFAYKLPPALTFSSAGYGAAFGLFPISWIVFWAITLYRVTVDMGKFEIIKSSMGNLTSDARLQALLIAFAFGAFVEGAAGLWNSRRRCRGHVGRPRLLAFLCFGPMPGGQHRSSRLRVDRDTRGHPRRDYRLAPGSS